MTRKIKHIIGMIWWQFRKKNVKGYVYRMAYIDSFFFSTDGTLIEMYRPQISKPEVSPPVSSASSLYLTRGTST